MKITFKVTATFKVDEVELDETENINLIGDTIGDGISERLKEAFDIDINDGRTVQAKLFEMEVASDGINE